MESHNKVTPSNRKIDLLRVRLQHKNSWSEHTYVETFDGGRIASRTLR